jgi:hypothetical protein
MWYVVRLLRFLTFTVFPSASSGAFLFGLGAAFL